MDDVGFDEFAAAETVGLLRYATALAGGRELAGDLVQEVLVRAFRKWELVSGADNPSAYIRTMLTREFLSWRRRWSTRNVVLGHGDLPEGPAVADHAGAVADRDEIQRRLAVLPRRQRAVLVLRYYQGLTDREIAAELGCSAVTVRGYASRAFATLRSDPARAPLPTGDTS